MNGGGTATHFTHNAAIRTERNVKAINDSNNHERCDGETDATLAQLLELDRRRGACSLLNDDDDD